MDLCYCRRSGCGFPNFPCATAEHRNLAKIIPLLPAILIYAAVNAFNEELYFRATLLSTLPQAIGKNHAMLINMVFFGLAHYLYGSPPGLVGFLMTGFLAYLLGKSMLETKGFLWAWFIHFLPDVVIFASYAIAWLRS
jgi:membrane protease YdiL (CAAX protease family)